MVSLQSIEEALEKEIQKFEEIGNEPCSISDSFSTDLNDSTLCETTIKEENLYRQEIHLGVKNSVVSKSTQESTELSVIEAQSETTINEEDLYRQKIHLGVENPVVSKPTQESAQLSVTEAQKCLAGKQIQMLHRLKDAEHKADILKTQAEELEASCGKLLATEEVLKMQNRLYEYALCLIAQIMLFLFVFVIFMLRPKTSGIVPT